MAKKKGDLTILAGRRLREARNRVGWTQGQLAEAIGLSLSYCSEIERGYGPITLDLLERFGEAFCLPALWFLGIETPEEDQRQRRWYAKMLREIRALIPPGIDAQEG